VSTGHPPALRSFSEQFSEQFSEHVGWGGAGQACGGGMRRRHAAEAFWVST